MKQENTIRAFFLGQREALATEAGTDISRAQYRWGLVREYGKEYGAALVHAVGT